MDEYEKVYRERCAICLRSCCRKHADVHVVKHDHDRTMNEKRYTCKDCVDEFVNKGRFEGVIVSAFVAIAIVTTTGIGWC